MAKIAPTAPKDAPKDLIDGADAETPSPLPLPSADAPKPGTMQAGPGVLVPHRPAAVFSMPDVTTKHVSDAFPDAMPQPAPGSPGVWVKPNGEIYQPRERRGGQFSFLVIDLVNPVTKRERRVALPLKEKDNVDAYGIRGMERVTARTEVVCDFEDEMLSFLKEFGMADAGDPLAQRMRARGLSYDDAPTPGLMGPKG